ncbi:MAG: CapA family protein [Eubacteriales bacterium]|nr:CapA family protein [Eubacteriales bacterium]
MDDYSEKRTKKDGIKAHKAAQQARTDRETRRRQLDARQKRRRKRQIQRLILIAIMVLILVFFILIVRAAVKGISHKIGEKKAKATAMEIENGKSETEEKTAVITTAGDIIMHKPFLESSVYFDGENYDYNPIFTYMKEIYEAADFAVVTTEYALTDGNYSGYPTFCSPDAIAEALAENGLDMCLLANNHIYDNGDEGLQRTMDVLTEKNLLYTGTRKSEDEKNYMIQDVNGIKIGFFNYVFETEKVDGYKTINGIAVSKESENLINSFQEAEPQSLYDDVEQILTEMEEAGVEYTIAYMHWGVEYQTKENSYQDAIAQKLCDMGIDALIASHPHVIQPVDLLESSDGKHKMVCAYAIGNHLSNQRTEYMDGLTNGYSEDGMVVTLTIHRDTKGKVTLEKADFIPTWVYHDQDVDDEYFILPLAYPDEIKEASGLDNIASDIDASLERTNGIVGDGVKKVQEALPLEQ